MRKEIKRWLIKCDNWPYDRCFAQVVVDSDTGQPPLPDGWGIREVHDCGMTGYTQREELCPVCLKARDEAP